MEDAPVIYFPRVSQFEESYKDLEPLYRQHYKEMQDRFEKEGIKLADFNPQLSIYCSYSRVGLLINFVIRAVETVVGYCNVYVTCDMHNGEKIATEDTIYIIPSHRGRDAGRLLVEFVHQHLRQLGVKRLNVTTSTDLKVANWLVKRGYQHTAHCMTICLN